mmetsp:Transcript_31971/g.32596  ORF Transcript_31971/g.32596 Transcript_31971/m.32596 type:complete len:84 (+) Transcript_31971:311-562(+)
MRKRICLVKERIYSVKGFLQSLLHYQVKKEEIEPDHVAETKNDIFSRREDVIVPRLEPSSGKNSRGKNDVMSFHKIESEQIEE